MLEQALRTYLLTVAPITALVADRIHVGDQAFGTLDDLPAITLEAAHVVKLSGSEGGRLEQLDGVAVGLQFPMYDIVCHGPLWETSIPLAALVRRALQALSLGGTIAITVAGVAENVVIEQVDLLAEWDENEEHLGHGNTNKPRALRYRIGWRESVASV